MPDFNCKYNTWGGLLEIRFKPSFEYDGRYNAVLGQRMLAYGNFNLDGWQWDAKNGELYKEARHDAVLPNDPVYPKTETQRIDGMVSDLLKDYDRWLTFQRITETKGGV